MTSFRSVLAGVGVAVAVAGLAMIVDPSLAGVVPSGEHVVVVIGVLAGVQGARVLWHRYRSDLDVGTVENDPETAPAGPAPGTDFDELAVAAGNVDSGRTLRSRRKRLRRRLRRAIVAALRRRDHDREAAEAAVEAGTWTDDPAAAALFTDDAADVDAGLLSTSSSGSLTRRANHAAAAVADLVGVETGEVDADDAPATSGDGSDRRGVVARDGDDAREAPEEGQRAAGAGGRSTADGGRRADANDGSTGGSR